MGQLSKPLVPDGPMRVFYDRLHALHLAAGQPSMRQLQRRTRTPRRPSGINPTTIHDLFAAPRLARLDVVRAVVGQLGGDVDEFVALWNAARHAQLDGGGSGAAAPPAAPPPVPVPSSAVPRELPPDVPAFTGRAGQLAELDDLLDSGANTVVISAISGTAGVGK